MFTGLLSHDKFAVWKYLLKERDIVGVYIKYVWPSAAAPAPFTLVASGAPCLDENRHIWERPVDVISNSSVRVFRRACTDWNRDVMLMKFLSLAAPEMVLLTISVSASDENILNMTFPFQRSLFRRVPMRLIECTHKAVYLSPQWKQIWIRPAERNCF